MRASIGTLLPRGSTILGLTTLGSYVLGLVRDRIFAHTFGASTVLDSYNAAFLVPDFLFNLLVASGIAAAAVPLFTELNYHHRQEAYRYMNALLFAATLAAAICALLVIVLAPLLSVLVAPGLQAQERVLVVQLMRVLAIPPLLFAGSNALGAMLIAEKRFLFYGLSPMLYNGGIILGTLWLAPSWGIMGTVAGTVTGAALHLIARVVDAWRSGWRWQPEWSLSTPAMRRTFRLMLPKMIGHPVELITFWVFTSIASLLAPGSIVVLNFARNFQSVPVSLIGIVMATAVFPSLAQAALVSRREVSLVLRRTMISMGGLSIVAALGLYFIRERLIAVLLGGGQFDVAAVAQTAATLGVFCLAIPTESVSHVLARAFYALQNTVTPVMWSVVSLMIAATSGYFLAGQFGIIGLPLGFFFGSLTKTIGLTIHFFVIRDSGKKVLLTSSSQ